VGVIDRALRLPVTVTVGAVLVILFGIIALYRVPVQLTPDVEKPKITVRTDWPGASPEEVEKEIIIPQEDKLKSIEGLLEIRVDEVTNYAPHCVTGMVTDAVTACYILTADQICMHSQGNRPVCRLLKESV